ncbi:hypothetical protein [Porphyromonas pogonae]|uniref:hypothetical protein n=1 Tax=Porphyromonas pogonae TaxID=867595 RepID=UPI002E7856BB|nr:hypothetical protein [Porphyromonas pogonae]
MLYQKSNSSLFFNVVFTTLFIFLFLSSCKKDREIDFHDKALVRIQTSLSLPELRASQTGAVNGDNPQAPTEEDGSGNERYIGRVRVLVFNGENIVKNIVYRIPGAGLEGNEKFFAYKNNDVSIIQMDMELPSGDYEFILIANEDPTGFAPLNLDRVTTKRQLIDGDTGNGINTASIQNDILRELILNERVTNKKLGLMMIGRQYFRVAPGGTPSSPTILNPVIWLKRTVSKVELTLKNTQANGTIYPNTQYMTFKRAELIKGNEVYNLIEENQTPVTHEEYLTTGGAYPNSYNQDISHTQGSIFNATQVLSAFIVERKNVIESAATILKIVVDNDGTERVFILPLYQMSNGIKDYNIYRNSIYRINGTLIGSEIKFETSVLVSAWSMADPINITINEGDLK